jgi:SAM-dependent methyltransferase
MSKDLFSSNSPGYAAFRPTYPKELYDFIISNVSTLDAAWDCACGNGQVARDLSEHFKKVYATDHSQSQLVNAFQKENIIYSIAPAEASGFPDRHFDLVTVGQALHWFDIPAFCKEARRVSKPGGIVAAWGYSLLSVNSEINPLLNHFYHDIIGPYWDKERKLVDDQYKTIEFPFTSIETPSFEFSFEWTLDELAGYLTTWSSVQKYIKTNGVNPVHDFIENIRPMWHGKMKVSFPLFVLVGRV